MCVSDKNAFKRVQMVVLTAVCMVFVLVGRAEVVSNCFSVVEYGDCCTHLVCDLEMFAGMDFVLDRTQVNNEWRWKFGPHHSKGWSYAAVVMPGDMISYLNFRGEQASVDLNPEGEMYCAFTWNDPKPAGDTQDYLGWFHLREMEGKLTLVSCAVETERGYRMVVVPGDPIDWLCWTDSKTMITWSYKVYGDVCGIGCGRVGRSGVEFPGGGCSTGQLVIPEKIKGLPVVKIESYAFNGCEVGELYIPESVTNIASLAFKDGNVSTMYFEGDAPTVEEQGFDGLGEWCACYAKIDADGWSNDIVWHGIWLAFKEEVIERKDEFERERVDGDGVRWHDDVELTERIYRMPKKWGEGWCLREEVYCETNVFTRLAGASDETRFMSHHYRCEGSVEYYDLRLKKSEEFQIVREERIADCSYLASYGSVKRAYDEEGRVATENIEIEWQKRPDEEGVIDRRESYERTYKAGCLVASLHKTEVKRNDQTSEIMSDRIENTWNDEGLLTKSQQHIDERDGRGFWRETDVGVDWYYWDGNVIHREEKKTVSGSDGFRWHNIVDDYNNGVHYWSSSSSGESWASYNGETTGMGPGEVRVVSAKSEEDALGKVACLNLTVVEGGAALPVPMDVYMGYFKATATQVGEDQWRVAYDVDPEAIELAESVADIGPQLGAVASGDANTIIISAKPGLFYGIATAESLVGPFVCPHKTYAWGESVELPAPDPKSELFMRISVGAKE